MQLSNLFSNHQQTFHDNHHHDAQASGLPITLDGEGTTALLLVGAVMLTVASIGQNILFAFSIANGLAGITLACILLIAFNLLEIAFPTLVRSCWRHGRHLMAIVVSVSFLCAASVSFVAGVCYFADQVEKTEDKRAESTPEFQRNQRAQEMLQAQSMAIAVSPEDEQAAKRKIQELEKQWETAYAQNSIYFERDYTPKYVSQRLKNDTWHNKTAQVVHDVMRPIDQAITAQKKIIEQAASYRATMTTLDKMQAASPTIAEEQKIVPGFKTLAKSFHSVAGDVKASVMSMANVFMIFLAAVAWYAYTQRTERKVMSFDDMIRAQYQQAAFKKMEAEAQIHEAEVMREVGERMVQGNSKQAQAIDDQRNQPAIHESYHDDECTGHACSCSHTHSVDDGRRTIGQDYPCVSCGETYTANAPHHLRCTDCRKEIKRVAAAKSRAKKANINDA